MAEDTDPVIVELLAADREYRCALVEVQPRAAPAIRHYAARDSLYRFHARRMKVLRENGPRKQRGASWGIWFKGYIQRRKKRG